MNKKGKIGSGIVMLVIGIGVVGILAAMGVFGDLSALMPGALPGAIPLPQRQVIQGCSSNTTPEIQLVALDKINAGTARTDGMDANVYINGTYFKGFRLSSDSTVDVSPGDGYSIFFTGTANNHDLLGAVATGNVPCEELSVVNVTVAQTGTMSMTAFNDDDGLANTGADLQGVSDGETVSIDFEIKENTADKCLGTANSTLPLALCVDYNSHVLKAPVIKLNGASLTAIAVPEGHSSVTSLQGGSTDQDATTCVALAGTKEICDYAKVTGFSFQLEGKASASPNIKGNSDLNVYLYQPQLYKNSESGTWDWGYSNPVDANIIIMPEVRTIYLE